MCVRDCSARLLQPHSPKWVVFQTNVNCRSTLSAGQNYSLSRIPFLTFTLGADVPVPYSPTDQKVSSLESRERGLDTPPPLLVFPLISVSLLSRDLSLSLSGHCPFYPFSLRIFTRRPSDGTHPTTLSVLIYVPPCDFHRGFSPNFAADTSV